MLGVAELHGFAEKCGRDHGPRRDGRWLVRGLRGWWLVAATGEADRPGAYSGRWDDLKEAHCDDLLQRGDAWGRVLVVKVRPQRIV